MSENIEKALEFLDSLCADDSRCDYWEVAEEYHSEHRVYNQSQYLLSVMFKILGKESNSKAIRSKHDPNEIDNDPTRPRRIAGDRFCVLDDDSEKLPTFYLDGNKNTENSDEIALLALFWLKKKHRAKLPHYLYRRYAKKLWKKLVSRYDMNKGVLEMDIADRKRTLYPVYKVALLGILARKMKKENIVDSICETLKKWQDPDGGWVTDRTLELEPDGVANIETTALSILALKRDQP